MLRCYMLTLSSSQEYGQSLGTATLTDTEHAQQLTSVTAFGSVTSPIRSPRRTPRDVMALPHRKKKVDTFCLDLRSSPARLARPLPDNGPGRPFLRYTALPGENGGYRCQTWRYRPGAELEVRRPSDRTSRVGASISRKGMPGRARGLWLERRSSRQS
jgi:hypothetical protein